MGESQGTLFPLEFNRSIRLEARPELVSGESGSLLMRALMDRLGYLRLFARYLRDPRDAARVTHPFEFWNSGYSPGSSSGASREVLRLALD